MRHAYDLNDVLAILLIVIALVVLASIIRRAIQDWRDR